MHAVATHETCSITSRRRPVAHFLATTSRVLFTDRRGVCAPVTALVWPDSVTSWLSAEHPMVEVTAYDGGQPLWPVIIGVE